MEPSAALSGDPTPITSVNNTSQTVPRTKCFTQSTVSQPSRLVTRSGQLQEQVSSVEGADRIVALKDGQPRPSTNQAGPV